MNASVKDEASLSDVMEELSVTEESSFVYRDVAVLVRGRDGWTGDEDSGEEAVR